MEFISFEEIASTNKYVRRNLKLKEFDVVIAKKQTDDQLKRGNIWISDKGGVFFSFWIQDRYELQKKIEIFSCYIVSEIIKGYIKESSKNNSKDESQNLKYKWPNDIYYKDKKISSIFCEKVRNKIIISIRINVNNSVDEIKDKATSLLEIFSQEYSTEEIIEKIMRTFQQKIERLSKEWEEILFSLNSNNFLKNRKIKIEKNGKYLEKEYRFSRVNRAGRLLIIGKGDKEETRCETSKFLLI